MAAVASHGRSFYQVKVSHETMYIDKRYQKLSYIGGGAYGFVCAATDSTTGRRVAIKKIKDVFRDLVDAKRILREIKLLRHLGGHQNIIWILDIMVYPNSTNFRDLYIVTDLMDTDLSHIISSQQTLSDNHIKYFLYQMVRGLKYVHSAGVLHRDLKPQNVLVNANCELVVCDFGLARAIGRRVDEGGDDPLGGDPAGDLTTYVVTRWYRAPELLCGVGMYDAAVDIWSVGCILAEVLGRRALFPGRNFNHMMQLIVDCLGAPSEESMWFIRSERVRKAIRKLGRRSPVDLRRLYPHANPQALDLLKQMLVFDPSKRITVVEALAHPYLADYHYPDDEPTAPSVVEFPFDKMGALSKAFLQAKMVEEMMSLASDKPPPTSRVPVAAPAPAPGAPDADADTTAAAAAAVEAEERARAREAVAAQAEEALKQQKRDEARANALAEERRRALMGAMGGGSGGGGGGGVSKAVSAAGGDGSKHSLHKPDPVSEEAAAGFDRSAGTGRLSSGLEGALTAPEVEAKINARISASESRMQEAIRRAVAEAMAPVVARLDRLESAVAAVAGPGGHSGEGRGNQRGRDAPATEGSSASSASGVRFAAGPSATPEQRPPSIRAASKEHVQFAGVTDSSHRAYPKTPAPELGGGKADSGF